MMKPCPLCEHVPCVDSTPVSDGWNTCCGNCGTHLWDVMTAPHIVNRAYEAKQRDIWGAIAMLYTGLAHLAHQYPVIVTGYMEAKEYAEEASERAQDATYTDAKLTAALDRLRGV